MAVTPGSLVFVAHDASDPSGAALGTLTHAFDKRVTVEEDGEGAGEFSINTNSAQAAWTEPGNYIAVYRDTVAGDPIAGFWIEPGTDVVLDGGEEGAEVGRRGGQGPIACLEEAIVWHRAFSTGLGRINRRRGRWIFEANDFPIVVVLLRLIREARARNVLLFTSAGFNRNVDSDGNAWPTDTKVDRFTVPIGATLTEVVTMLRTKGLRIEMDASFRLQAWPDDRENDLSGSIELEAGVDIRDSVTRSRKARRVRSHVLVGGERRRGGERFVSVGNADIRAELGRRKEAFRDTGKTGTVKSLTRVGRRSLRRWRKLQDGAAAVPVIDTTGQVALVDYMPGDTVTLTIPGVYSDGQKIASISLIETESGEYDPVLEFGAPIPDPSGEDWSDDAATAVRS